MPMFSSGIVLAQHKEPALSQKMVQFLHPHMNRCRMPGQKPAHSDADTSAGFPLPDTDTLIQIAQEAAITDEIDGSLLAEKLIPVRGSTATIIVDAIDDEPYVSSKLAPLLQMQREVLGGLDILKYLCDSSQIFILVYKHMADIESHIPAKIDEYPVLKVRGGYPATPSFLQLRKLGQGPKLVVGVGAVIRLYAAVHQNLRQHSTFVTVAGNCIAKPVNMEVSLGMNVAQVLERIGLSDEPTDIVCGGPMRGYPVRDPENTLILPTTRAILAVRRSQKRLYTACIGCGRCEQVCPMGLNPAYIHRFIKRGQYAQMHHFDAHLCIGCGTCSYICPSRLDIVESTRKAKEFALTHYRRGKPSEQAKEEQDAG